MDKELKDMTRQEMTRMCTWDMMQQLAAGARLEDQVWYAQNMALRWKAERDEADKKVRQVR